jgi:hypothetical protein
MADASGTPAAPAEARDKNLDPNLQPEEARERNLETAPAGTNTATGLAQREDDKIAQLDDLDTEERGADEELIGEAQESGDYIAGEGQELLGLQAEKSAFATNGSIPPRMVASPSGLIPVSAVAFSPDAAEERLLQQREVEYDAAAARDRYEAISEERIRGMSGAEARAVMHDRGYMSANDSLELSNRAARRALINAQQEDENLQSGGTKKSGRKTAAGK